MKTALHEKRGLVIGGSGGIDAACARLFAAEGAQVVVHYDRGREPAAAVAAQVVALASPLLSGHITGHAVTIAGGLEGRVLHEG